MVLNQWRGIEADTDALMKGYGRQHRRRQTLCGTREKVHVSATSHPKPPTRLGIFRGNLLGDELWLHADHCDHCCHHGTCDLFESQQWLLERKYMFQFHNA